VNARGQAGGGAAGPVGLVLVSHSARLAQGAAELAGQLAGDEVRVEAAGGTDDGGLGTSIEVIERAVAAADRGAGVVLLADLGSAVLTIRLLLEDGAAAGADARAVLADAPFVEGAVAAAVAAASGADLAAVVAEAEAARSFRKVP
jgi:dihydroxyacetone kinase phosphotransfer subunit